MDSNVKKFITKFFNLKDVQALINEDKWGEVLNKFNDKVSTIEYNGSLIDLLVKAEIDFCPYMERVIPYCFFRSTLLYEANLNKCSSIGTRAFRKSNIKKIILSKDYLKDLDSGILSGVENPVTIIWDGTYKEWINIRRNSNCWYNYKNEVSIHCIDGVFIEDNSFN